MRLSERCARLCYRLAAPDALPSYSGCGALYRADDRHRVFPRGTFDDRWFTVHSSICQLHRRPLEQAPTKTSRADQACTCPRLVLLLLYMPLCFEIQLTGLSFLKRRSQAIKTLRLLFIPGPNIVHLTFVPASPIEPGLRRTFREAEISYLDPILRP